MDKVAFFNARGEFLRAAKSRIIEDYPNRNILPSIPTSTDELKEMVDEIHELA